MRAGRRERARHLDRERFHVARGKRADERPQDRRHGVRARDDGGSDGRGFEHRQPEALTQRRVHQSDGLAVQSGEACRIDVAEKADVAAIAPRRRLREIVRTRHEQVGGERGIEALPRGEERREIFVRPVIADEEKERARGSLRPRRFAEAVVGAERHDRDLACRHAEIAPEIVDGALVIRDDAPRARAHRAHHRRIIRGRRCV